MAAWVLFAGFTVSDASTVQIALWLSLIGIAIAVPALVIALYLLLAEGKKPGEQVGQLEELTERADRLGRTD